MGSSRAIAGSAFFAASLFFAAPGRAPASAAFPFAFKWGSFGAANGQFNGPEGMCFAGDELYVADSQNHRIQVFAADGTFLRAFGSWGAGNGQFKSPFAVAVDSQGNVYVADRYNHRVQKFTSAGAYLIQWGGQGADPGQFDSPWNVVVDFDDHVYVVEFANHRVQRFTTDGTLLDIWGGFGSAPGQFEEPHGLDVASDGSVYVAGSLDDRIQKFTHDGIYVLEWGGVHGALPGQFHHANSVGIDAEDFVYVGCWYTHPHGGRFQKFTPNGVYIAEHAGPNGTGDGEFDHSGGIALHADGRVYVADTKNHRVQVFSPNHTTAAPPLFEAASWGRIKAEFR